MQEKQPNVGSQYVCGGKNVIRELSFRDKLIHRSIKVITYLLAITDPVREGDRSHVRIFQIII